MRALLILLMLATVASATHYAMPLTAGRLTVTAGRIQMTGGATLPSPQISYYSWSTNGLAAQWALSDGGLSPSGKMNSATFIIVSNEAGNVFLHEKAATDSTAYFQLFPAGSVLTNSLTQLSMSVWLRRTNLVTQTIVAMPGYTQHFYTQVGGGNLIHTMRRGTTSMGITNSTLNTWYQWGVTWIDNGTGAVDTLKHYINGTLVQTQTNFDGATAGAAANFLLDHRSLANSLDVDDFNIWTNALTDDQILQLYQGGRR